MFELISQIPFHFTTSLCSLMDPIYYIYHKLYHIFGDHVGHCHQGMAVGSATVPREERGRRGRRRRRDEGERRDTLVCSNALFSYRLLQITSGAHPGWELGGWWGWGRGGGQKVRQTHDGLINLGPVWQVGVWRASAWHADNIFVHLKYEGKIRKRQTCVS